jgi:hypothetical protein
MGLFESIFGPSKKLEKAERELAELKATIAQAEREKRFTSALESLTSVWIRKQSGQRQYPSPLDPKKTAHKHYLDLLNDVFLSKKHHAEWSFHMSPAGGGRYQLHIISNLENNGSSFVFYDGGMPDDLSFARGEFEIHLLNEIRPNEAQAAIEAVLYKALVESPAITDSSKENYDVIWMNGINTGEQMPILYSFSEVEFALKNHKSIRLNAEHEVAGALVFIARGKEGPIPPNVPHIKRIEAHADNLVGIKELVDGCDKVDLLCREVIASIRNQFGFRAAIECNVGAFSLTGNRLHAADLAIDFYNYLVSEKIGIGGLIEMTNPKNKTYESFRKSAKIIQQIVIPKNKPSILTPDFEKASRPILESVTANFF